MFRRLAARAGVTLDPLCCWLLFRIQEQAPVSQESLARRLRVPGEKLTPSIESLIQNELVTVTSKVDGQAGGQIQLTDAGQQAINKLAAAYEDSLTELLDGWSPEQEAELVVLLRRVAMNLLSEDSSNELAGARG